VNEKKRASIPKKIEKLVFQEAQSKCAFCAVTDVHSLEIHHIRGREDGGANEPDNLIVVCGNCHSKITFGVLSLADVVTKKRELYWTARQALASAQTTPPQPKTGIHQEIHGNGNVQSINTFTTPPTVKKVIERREGSITSDECRQVQEWIEALAEGTIGMSRADAYPMWWGYFKKAFHLEKYEELQSMQMVEAERWFRMQRARQTRGLKSKAPDEWRRERYTAIKSAMTKMGVTNEHFYPEVACRLKMKTPFTSLKHLTKRDLQRVYDLALRDARMS